MSENRERRDQTGKAGQYRQHESRLCDSEREGGDPRILRLRYFAEDVQSNTKPDALLKRHDELAPGTAPSAKRTKFCGHQTDDELAFNPEHPMGSPHMALTPVVIQAVLSRFFVPERRAWRGEMPLPIVFWGYGVGVSWALAALYESALDLGELGLQQTLIFLSLAYTVWILVAIWRCAANTAPFWGSLARWLTVAWGLNSAFVLFFLQIELLLRYARG